jgi:cytidylate kinase
MHQGIVTIDGPAGAGKSTVARRLARELGFDFLDTGAMYRAVAAMAIDQGIDTADYDATADLAETLHLRFDWKTDPPRLVVDARDMTPRLRDADTTQAVSDVASNSRVRQMLVRAQRWVGAEHPALVTEGRDQGSVVFPDAAVKFFLDASPEERARRRADQLRASGKDEVDEQEILRQILYRDERDRSRSDGPLICPDGAQVVDSSDMSIDQVVQAMYDHVLSVLDAERGEDVEAAS